MFITFIATDHMSFSKDQFDEYEAFQMKRCLLVAKGAVNIKICLINGKDWMQKINSLVLYTNDIKPMLKMLFNADGSDFSKYFVKGKMHQV